MNKEVEVRIKPKPHGSCLDGEFVSLAKDGFLSISGYEGITHLDAAEARELAQVLLTWADAQSTE